LKDLILLKYKNLNNINDLFFLVNKFSILISLIIILFYLILKSFNIKLKKMNPFDCMNDIMNLNIKKDCIALLISKLLGFSIIFFSAILKVPQIKYMLKSKTDEGLSYLSMYVEIFLFTFNALYSYHKNAPFSTYGENIIILIQSLIILLLAWSYSQKGVAFFEKLIFLTLFNGLIYICLNGLLSEQYWEVIGSSSIPLLTVSRISQIYNSFKTKSTGSLAMFTFVLSFLGNVARVFTTVTESFEIPILLMYLYAAFLNLVIMFQIFLYGSKSEKGKEIVKPKSQ